MKIDKEQTRKQCKLPFLVCGAEVKRPRGVRLGAERPGRQVRRHLEGRRGMWAGVDGVLGWDLLMALDTLKSQVRDITSRRRRLPWSGEQKRKRHVSRNGEVQVQRGTGHTRGRARGGVAAPPPSARRAAGTPQGVVRSPARRTLRQPLTRVRRADDLPRGHHRSGPRGNYSSRQAPRRPRAPAPRAPAPRPPASGRDGRGGGRGAGGGRDPARRVKPRWRLVRDPDAGGRGVSHDGPSPPL